MPPRQLVAIGLAEQPLDERLGGLVMRRPGGLELWRLVVPGWAGKFEQLELLGFELLGLGLLELELLELALLELALLELEQLEFGRLELAQLELEQLGPVLIELVPLVLALIVLVRGSVRFDMVAAILAIKNFKRSILLLYLNIFCGSIRPSSKSKTLPATYIC